MIGRRLMVLMAVLLGLTALATSLAPRPRAARDGVTATPTPAAAASPAVRAKPSQIVARTLEADAKQPVTVRAHVGDTIRLVITGDVLDSVEVEGFDEIEQIDPESPALIELFADERASHAIRLIDSGRRIAQLTID